MRDNFIEIINQLVSRHLLFIILIGLVHLVIIERKTIKSFFREKHIKTLQPLLVRSLYIISGIVLIVSAFAITNYLLIALTPENLQPPVFGAPTDFWATIKYQTQYTGLFAVIGFILAGYTLILSAGGKWLLNLSKLLITLTILYMFFSILIAYA